jgi:hypothetical protein
MAGPRHLQGKGAAMPTIALPRRTPIDAPEEVAAVEALLSAIAGMIAATGGFAALMGRDLLGMEVAQRAAILTAMYDDGEVVLGWRDGRDGAVVNMALERLEADGPLWRAEFFVEGPQGHESCGAMADRSLDGLSRAVMAALGRGAPRGLEGVAAATAGAVRTHHPPV